MKATLILTCALLLACTGAALAQTPDGFPPSLETVCDMESGSAFGWCNAYCEAMDCELANDNDPLTEPKASATACSKVRSKFQQSTGRDMPCEVTCPCNDPAVSSLFVGFVTGQIPATACFTAPVAEVEDGVFVTDESIFFPFAFSVQVGGEWICGLADGLFALPITPEQGMYCADLVEQAAVAQGLTCGPGPI